MASRDAKPPPPTDMEGPERYTALYDPDTVFPARMEGIAPKSPGAGATGEDGEPSTRLYAEGEKRRVKPPMSDELVRRIADRVERRARAKKK